jgi:hypothetical protein
MTTLTAAKIARELREREFYGLANSRIKWLLAERKRLVAENAELRTAVEWQASLAEARRHDA